MRIVIAEDSVLLLEGLTRLLEAEGHEVAGDRTADELLLRFAAGGPLPDLVITDVRMPPTHTDEGLRAALRLRAEHPNLPILVLSQYIEQHYAADLFGAGVSGLGYVLKDRIGEIDEFVAAVEQVAGGGTVIDPDVVTQLIARRRGDGLERLTTRERQVLTLMAQGRSNEAIARELVVTTAAVEKHITSILTKLDLPPDGADHRRVLAVLRYLQHA